MERVVTDGELAQKCVGMLEDRWSHVQGVGSTAEDLAATTGRVSPDVIRAAWLHDVGYGPAVRDTGFHPLDGARLLQSRGESDAVVSLVAHHTGAKYEAYERGVADELREFREPDPDDLAILTMIDLGTDPQGLPIRDVDRIAEILSRYEPDDPVHRAVTRSGQELLDMSRRAKDVLGLSEDWPLRT